MPPTKYFYRAFFRTDGLNVFEGFDTGLRDGKGLGFAQAWHKGCWVGSPYAVYNEFICGEIGRFMRLPIPPFCLTHHETADGKAPLFSSLDFAGSRAELPAVLAAPCVEKMPLTCAGVLALDIFIANCDRHDENLVVDDVTNPRQMHVFDHGNALLGGNSDFGGATGAARLEECRDRLGVTGGAVSGGIPHVFLPLIRNGKDLFYWVQRIREIPNWFIRDICRETRGHGLSRALADSCEEFLLHRRKNLSTIIRNHRDQLAIETWPEAGEELFE